jgi:hypothetical protein
LNVNNSATGLQTISKCDLLIKPSLFKIIRFMNYIHAYMYMIEFMLSLTRTHISMLHTVLEKTPVTISWTLQGILMNKH